MNHSEVSFPGFADFDFELETLTWGVALVLAFGTRPRLFVAESEIEALDRFWNHVRDQGADGFRSRLAVYANLAASG